jgi:hypothetical protein
MSAVFLVKKEHTPYTQDRLIVWIPDNRAPSSLTEQLIENIIPDKYKLPFCVHISNSVPSIISKEIELGTTFVAHNAEVFDAEAWEVLVGGPQPSWYDTIHCCRAAGLPAGLDKAARAIGIEGKDQEGADSLKLLYTAKIAGKIVVYPVGTVELWQQMLRYNIQDVLALEGVYNATLPYGESDVLQANSDINSRGVPVNVAFASMLRDLWHLHKQEVKQEAYDISHGGLSDDDLQSPAKVKAWLRSLGLVVESLNRAAIDAMIADPDSFFGDTDDERVQQAIAVLHARQSGIRATEGKVSRLLGVVDNDGRIRDCIIAYGAHTGRFSSRDFQFHNMFRGVSKLDIAGILSEYQEIQDICQKYQKQLADCCSIESETKQS